MSDKRDDWHVRLPDPKEQLRVIDLYHKSGSKSKSDFVRARLLGEHFKVMLRELIGLTKELTALQEKAVSLTIDYREK
ncbi:MAG: hypothetical protein SOZ80_05985 [Prevotella sp.]|uniref:plasmid mobilization protein n=1 Tax=Prevotella sp. TaxID=59823 RepID=UPI002A2A73E4|nr:hypothetical protein [Prevotella sp.]MDD7318505.1 hypothetical protein [Prevotellaceae bacterium]MDY4020310.1 hypothetical protein [Prevotella sp.]